MHLTAEATTDASAQFVYEQATDFDQLVTVVEGFGFTVTEAPDPDARPSWTLSGKVGGMDVDLQITIVEQSPHNRLAAKIIFNDIHFDSSLTITEVSATSCQLHVTSTGTAKGVKAKVILKGLSMLEGKFNHQLGKAVNKAAKHIGIRYSDD